MKIISKISIVFVICMMVFFVVPNNVRADNKNDSNSSSSAFGGLIDKAKPASNDIPADSSSVTGIIRKLLGFLEVASGLMSILVIAFTGFQYIIASDAEMKSEMKKKMLPLIIGLILVFSASSIVSFILGAVQSGAATTVQT